MWMVREESDRFTFPTIDIAGQLTGRFLENLRKCKDAEEYLEKYRDYFIHIFGKNLK